MILRTKKSCRVRCKTLFSSSWKRKRSSGESACGQGRRCRRTRLMPKPKSEKPLKKLSYKKQSRRLSNRMPSSKRKPCPRPCSRPYRSSWRPRDSSGGSARGLGRRCRRTRLMLRLELGRHSRRLRSRKPYRLCCRRFIKIKMEI